MTYRKDDIDLLLEFSRGKLSAVRRKQLQARLQTDRNLAELQSLIDELLARSKDLDWTTLRGAVLDIAGRLFEDYRNAQRRRDKAYGIRIFDSSALPLPEGVRPAAVDTRRIKYRLDVYTVNLSFYPVSPDSYEMIGQVSWAPEGTVFEVTLQAKGFRKSVQTDKYQLFRFEQVPAAACRLTFRLHRKVAGRIDIEL